MSYCTIVTPFWSNCRYSRSSLSPVKSTQVYSVFGSTRLSYHITLRIPSKVQFKVQFKVHVWLEYHEGGPPYLRDGDGNCVIDWTKSAWVPDWGGGFMNGSKNLCDKSEFEMLRVVFHKRIFFCVMSMWKAKWDSMFFEEPIFWLAVKQRCRDYFLSDYGDDYWPYSLFSTSTLQKQMLNWIKKTQILKSRC